MEKIITLRVDYCYIALRVKRKFQENSTLMWKLQYWQLESSRTGAFRWMSNTTYNQQLIEAVSLTVLDTIVRIRICRLEWLWIAACRTLWTCGNCRYTSRRHHGPEKFNWSNMSAVSSGFVSPTSIISLSCVTNINFFLTLLRVGKYRRH